MTLNLVRSFVVLGSLVSISAEAQVLSFQSVQSIFSDSLSSDPRRKDIQVLRRPAGPANGPQQNSLNQGYLKLPDGWIYSLFPAVKNGNG